MSSMAKPPICAAVLLLIAGQCANAEPACQPKQTQPSTPTDRFVVIKDRTVLDTATNLVWQRCLQGQRGDTCQEGEPATFTWLEALTLDVPDERWRLPNIRELESIVELQCASPAINADVFPNQPVGKVWSSSPYRFYPHYAWYLDFQDGVFLYTDRTDSMHVRLVRVSAD